MSSCCLIFGVVVFLFLSSFSITIHGHGCSDGFMSEAKKRINNSMCKRYTESFGVEYAWNLEEKSRRLDILFGGTLAHETGWLAWGLNPGPEAQMVGTRALIGLKQMNGTLNGGMYNITSYTRMGCQLLPSPIDLNISNFKFSYVDSLRYYVIEATIVLPLSYDLSKVNHVWQVGRGIAGMEPKMHLRSVRNYDCKEALDLRLGKGRGEIVHRCSRIRAAHGILNIIGWGILLPFGVIIARNFREFPIIWVHWKHVHISCQIFGYLVGATGWAVGIYLGRLSTNYSFPKHGTFGLCIIIFATLQMLAFILKPENDEGTLRMYWNMYHHFLGYSLLVVSCINILKGTKIMYQDQMWRPAYFVVIGCLAFIFFAFEVFSWSKFIWQKYDIWRICCDQSNSQVKTAEESGKRASSEAQVKPCATPENK